jgi:lon-related putative ATP-dependent protease
MSNVRPLAPAALCWRLDANQLPFETTDQLEDLEGFLGQDRALDAVQFGIGIRQHGYNLYVLGPPGVGKRTIVQSFLKRKSAGEPTPNDWCYVNNFADPQRPTTIQLPAGRGARLAKDLDDLLEDLQSSIPAALELEQHKSHIQEVEQEAKERQDNAFQVLAKEASAHNIQLVRTPGGFALAPVRDGDVLSPEEFEKLTVQQKEEIQKAVAALQDELKDLIEKLPAWRKEVRDKVKQLDREATQWAIDHAFAQVREKYTDLPEVLAYLDAVKEDVIEKVDDFRPADEEQPTPFGPLPQRGRPFDAYRVNLIVDNQACQGAPVLYEEHPSYQNLIGRVEHESHLGMLSTSFMLIKPGALHRANGGYLVIDALRTLQQPYAWEGLKRALHARHIKIESLAESLSLLSTVSIEPAAIPLDVKVVLLGDRLLYYLLHQHDLDFSELFKVAADFEEDMPRGTDDCLTYARLIATLIRRERHLPFDRTAVARILEHSARVAGDAEKLTTHMRTVADLIREASYWAQQAEASLVTAPHVQLALDKQIHRVDRIRQRTQEEIQRGTLLIDTDGECVGQVNGLSVLDLGNFSFGQPSRITATARLGKGEVVDIEREVELGGAIHSKGVLILSSFLAARFARNHPLSLSASLVFEQSYGMVEGDSASVAELCALLSVLSEAPILQGRAVTGSVNQHGQVQPIGGVNQKIEGFFDVCRARGLTGRQGVLIPASNVRHLMLRADVVDACAAGQFAIYPIETVDEAVTMLTNTPAGTPDSQGRYPPGTINDRVAVRFRELFQLRQKLGSETKTERSYEF